MRTSSWSLAGMCFLTACSGYAPPNDLAGISGDQLVAARGTPDTCRQIEGGTRLEFPSGPENVFTIS
jgi:hypothetical protein